MGKLGLADKCGFVAYAIAIIIFIAGGIYWIDDDGFVRGIITSLFGAILSIAIGAMILPEIIRRNSEQIGLKRAKEANIELLNSINAAHRSFCEIGAEIGKSERWAKVWDDKDLKEVAYLIPNFYYLIDREEDSLSVHTKMTMGYIHPQIESRKEAYLHSLRLLRTITHSLAVMLGNSERSKQFKTADTELFMMWSALKRGLEDAVDLDAAITLNPNDASLNTAKGFALSHKCKFDEAIQWFDKAIGLDPRYAHAYAGKGAALKELNRATEADEALAKRCIGLREVVEG